MNTPTLADLARRVETIAEVVESLLDEKKPSHRDMTPEQMIEDMFSRQVEVDHMLRKQLDMLSWLLGKIENMELMIRKPEGKTDGAD